ncbi:MAG: NAD-dependent malic enzyme [Abditibacteriota bacterium]|nr:NAD-dependent malic enzyme [Abditibacteriota bacterium]
MNKRTPTPGNSIAVVIRYPQNSSALSEIVRVIEQNNGSLGPIDIVESERVTVTREFAVNLVSPDDAEPLVNALKEIKDAEVIEGWDRVFQMHYGGKIDVVSKAPLQDFDDLSMAYTPGVARVCKAIEAEPEKAFDFTIRQNTVAVITDGTAVLGLGNIGAVAGLPVMEGKAVLFKEFAGVNAFPVCVNTTDPEELVKICAAISGTFGGINLEDISSPRCFMVERELQKLVDIPVFHDDQHGTATVATAAFINAIKVSGKDPKNMRMVVSGAGASALACTRAISDMGIGDVVLCDRKGAIYDGRPGIEKDEPKLWASKKFNKENLKGSLKEVIKGADMFLGLSAPNMLTGEDIRTMNDKPIVFAMANPTPEVWPEECYGYASVVATGRSDYPNQINNVLCFPGLFRGLLEAGAKQVTREMQAAAAKAIASCVEEPTAENIMPSAFDPHVAESVCEAVKECALDEKAAKTPIFFDFSI